MLEESTRLSNRLFRFCVGLLLTIGLIVAVSWTRESPSYWLGAAVIILTAGWGGSLCLRRIQPGLFESPSAFNQFVLLTALLFCVHGGVYATAEASPWWVFMTPVPLFAMMFAMVFSQGAALFISCAVALCVALKSPRVPGVSDVGLDPVLGLDLTLGLVLAFGAATAVLGLRVIRRQSRPVITGLYVGLVQALVLLCVTLMSQRTIEWDRLIEEPNHVQSLLQEPVAAFAGGVLSGAILTCLLPAVERLLGVLTERRLLDLQDPSNELLRALMERAQGTFHHSLGVANLASGAAEGIGADSLLTRVGAYYHDIGKMTKPQYFVENMGEDKTIHDRLRPSISKMIIISHVKEGIQLAKEAGLPEKIVDMIPMHHGTTVVEFFYHKARKNRDPHVEQDPGEVEYRYPGPKPRFREAALLMLADSVEARAKVELHPNPNRFRVMVHEEIQKRLQDGQLNESMLTLSDLKMIEDSFVRTLTTMYHGRIKYPSLDEEDDDTPSEKRPSSSGTREANGRGTSTEQHTTVRTGAREF